MLGAIQRLVRNQHRTQSADRAFSTGSILAGSHDSRKERPPPSRPIPVAFPALDSPPEPSRPLPPHAWTSPGITAGLLRLRKPADVDRETLALLNVSFQPECDFEALLASISPDAASYLPPKAWLEPSDDQDSPLVSPPDASVKLLCNGKRVPDRNEFYTRAKELFFDKDDRKGPGPELLDERFVNIRY